MFRNVTESQSRKRYIKHRSATVPTSSRASVSPSTAAAAASKVANCTKRATKPAPRRADSAVFHRSCTLRPRYRALIFGLTYACPDVQNMMDGEWEVLEGCHNDAHAFAKMLRELYGWDDITVMTDEEHNRGTVLWPTMNNMKAKITDLVAGARAGDMFVIYYAGHSGQVPAVNDPYEADGWDEHMISVDGEMILDDDLRKMLVNPLPKGTRLTAIFDSCHSGTMLDLRLYPAQSRKSDMQTKPKESERKPRAQSLPSPAPSPLYGAIHWGRKFSWMPLRAASKFYAAMRSARRRLSEDHKRSAQVEWIPAITIDAEPGSSQMVELDNRTLAPSDVSSILTNPGPDTSAGPSEPPTRYEGEVKVISSAKLVQPAPATPLAGCPHCRALQLESPIVSSISACQDSQLAVEDRKKKTGIFTPELIKVLEQEPGLSFREVKAKLSPRIFEVCCSFVREALRKKRKHQVGMMPWQALQLGHEKAQHMNEPLLRSFPGTTRKFQ